MSGRSATRPQTDRASKFQGCSSVCIASKPRSQPTLYISAPINTRNIFQSTFVLHTVDTKSIWRDQESQVPRASKPILYTLRSCVFNDDYRPIVMRTLYYMLDLGCIRTGLLQEPTGDSHKRPLFPVSRASGEISGVGRRPPTTTALPLRRSVGITFSSGTVSWTSLRMEENSVD
jgi:hypothetical protein